jgi:hypothetical protein
MVVTGLVGTEPTDVPFDRPRSGNTSTIWWPGGGELQRLHRRSAGGSATALLSRHDTSLVVSLYAAVVLAITILCVVIARETAKADLTEALRVPALEI